MAAPFHHEELVVYREAIGFVAYKHELLQEVTRKAAVKDQLKRAGESIPVNIAGSNAMRSLGEQRRLVEIAMGSAAECAACLDVLRVCGLCRSERIEFGKTKLLEIFRMLSGLRRAKENVMQEEPLEYGQGRFGHERLEVYQVCLEAIRWTDRFLSCRNFDASTRDSLDRFTTSIVLNLAEGNAKRSANDRARYFDTAISAALRSASTLDVVVARGLATEVQGGKSLLAHVVSMLLGMQERVKTDSQSLS